MRSAGSALLGSRSTTTALDHLVDDRRRRRADGAHRAGGGRARGRGRRRDRRSRSSSPRTRCNASAVVYDRQGDAHYDVISAFIKSIRGSDPDAALFWLARMLEAGEDARFIARRLDRARVARTSGSPTRWRCCRRRPPRTRWSTSGCPRRGSTWRRRRSTWRARRSRTASIMALAAAMEDARQRRPGAGAPARRVVPGARGSWATGRATGTRTTSPDHHVEQEYLTGQRSRGRRYYEPSERARRRR